VSKPFLLSKFYGEAQELFVRSGRPQAALQMRKDLKHWEEALNLAKSADPSQLDDICREYASLLEMRGEYDVALEVFNRAVQYPNQSEAELAKGRGGIARCTIHLGDIRRGKQMALDSGSQQLCRECAQILESINQPSDAAQLYEKGGQFEKAASIYISTKNFNLAKPIMDKVSTPKLHLQYARAKEAEGKLQEAADAYEMARDFDSVVRLQLEHLGNPQKAFALVRMSRSAEGALMVAQFCKRNGDHGGAIEFLLLARRSDEAFALAQENEEMNRFVDMLGDAGTPEEYQRLATYFESKGEFSRAGDLHARCDRHQAAVKNYLKVGANCIDKAIVVVGKAQSDALTNMVVDYLMGETDGIQKDHNYLFRLHIALRNYEQAARTSVVIARQEQEMGNYKIAHTQLFDTFKELMSEGKRPPAELSRQLMLLHSYVLVKVLVKLGDHPGAARMLNRVVGLSVPVEFSLKAPGFNL
jgi:WD repeat-containing protein 19